MNMQEFSFWRVRDDICLWSPNLPLSESEMDEMVSDPQAMYLHSLRTHKRLPDRLHEAMLLFSFHPNFRREVQLYLLWVADCEEREVHMKAFRRSEILRDFVLAASMFLLGVTLISILVAEFLR